MPSGRQIIGRALMEIATDSTNFVKGLEDAKAKAKDWGEKVGDQAKKVGDTMQHAGTVMSIGVTAPFVLFAKTAVEGASSTEESLNKMRVVFKSTAGEIEAFAKTAAKNLGMSNQAALEAAGTFGNLFDALGLGQPQATQMSKEILTLSADLASFNNLDPTEVLEKLRSGLVGEAEPLRSLGVNINEAAVKAKALELGLGGVKGELTDAEKVTARYALIVEQTKNAQGDFANTADGLANSQRIAKAEMADMSAEMGKALLPIMQQGVAIIRTIIAHFMELSPEIRTGALVVVGLVAAIGPLLLVFGTLLTMLPLIISGITLLLGPVGLVIAAIALLAVAWSQNWGDIQGKTAIVIEFLSGWFELFRVIVTGVINHVVGQVKFAIDVITGLIETVRNAIAFIQNLANAITNMPGIQGIVGALSNVGGVFGLAQGGVVPGPIGAPQLAVVHGQETIIPAGGMSGQTININLDGEVVARVVGGRQQQRSFLAGGALG